MSIENKIWVDGLSYPYDTIPKYMHCYFDYTVKRETGILRFVGIHIHNNVVNIMLPKNMNNNQKNIYNISKILISGLNDNLLCNTGHNNKSIDIYKSDLYSNIKWLINDFKHNGIINNKKFILNKNHGRIDWSKTIKRCKPIVQNNNFIFDKPLRYRNNSFFDYLSIIHESIIYKIANDFGMYFNGFSYKKNFKPVNLHEYQKMIILLIIQLG